jgi:pyrimidine deaminase RibD-like protein
MRRAIVLSTFGLGTTSPNPPVGCVILDTNRIVGKGYHERKGAPHAENYALAAAGQPAGSWWQCGCNPGAAQPPGTYATLSPGPD